MLHAATTRHIVAIGAAYLAGALAYPSLPGPYVRNGLPIPMARPLIAFLLPTAAVVIYALFCRLWAHDSIRDRGPALEATYHAILFRVLLFIAALHGLILLQLTGVPGLANTSPRLVIVMVGGALMGIGNLLPRTRPNLVIGVRTSRTLADRSAWIHTHRISGYAAVGLGVVFVVSGALLPSRAIGVVVGIAGLAGAALIVALHRSATRG